MINITDMDIFLDSMNKKPNITFKSFTTSGIGNIQGDLCSRQIVITPAGKSQFRQLLPGFKRETYDAIKKDAAYEDFSQITNATELCEYHGTIGFFTASKDYMTYIKHGNPDKITVNVNGAEQAVNIPEILGQHITKEISLPDFEPSLPAVVEYPIFEKPSYNVVQEDKINGNTMYILNINLPYSYYSRIPVMDSAFSYDIDSKQFHLFDLTIEEGLKYFTDLVDQNVVPGIYISANDNKLNPIDFANAYIQIAKLLKLPHIPASLIVTGMPIPFLMETEKNCTITAAETNEICKPYFLFQE